MRKSLLALLWVFMLICTASGQDPLEHATAELVRLSAESNRAANSSQLYELIKIAESRRCLIEAAMKEHPEEVIKSALTSAQRRQLPAQVRALTEKNARFSGRLVTGVADDFDSHKATYLYELTTFEDRKVNLHFANNIQRMFRGDLIEVEGIEVGNDVAVRGDVTNLSPLSAHAARPIITSPDVTQKRVAVILYNFENVPREPYTPAMARATMFTNPASANDSSVNMIYQEMSYGKVSLGGALDATNGDVFGWYTIPNNTLNYANNSCGSVGAAAAEERASADGFFKANYDVIVYAFPQSICGYSGAGFAGFPGRVYYNLDYFSNNILVHEVGHAFGRNHAHSYNCVDEAGNFATISAFCTDSEYGDGFDYMGQPGLKHHFNGYDKNNPYMPGWLDAINIITIDHSSQAGEYELAPFELASTGPQLLRIARGDGQYYYFEFRQGAPTDVYGTNNPVLSGVLIRLAPDFAQQSVSHLLFASPTNPALTLGQTFTDTAFGISATVIAVAPNQSVRIRVSFDPSVCTPSVPGLSLNPQSQVGSSRQSFSYQFSLRNQDITACYGSSYNVKITVPQKWSVLPGSFSESLMPGDSVTREFTVTSPGALRKGSYVITGSAANAANGSRKSKSAVVQGTITIN